MSARRRISASTAGRREQGKNLYLCLILPPSFVLFFLSAGTEEVEKDYQTKDDVNDRNRHNRSSVHTPHEPLLFLFLPGRKDFKRSGEKNRTILQFSCVCLTSSLLRRLPERSLKPNPSSSTILSLLSSFQRHCPESFSLAFLLSHSFLFLYVPFFLLLEFFSSNKMVGVPQPRRGCFIVFEGIDR